MHPLGLFLMLHNVINRYMYHLNVLVCLIDNLLENHFLRLILIHSLLLNITNNHFLPSNHYLILDLQTIFQISKYYLLHNLLYHRMKFYPFLIYLKDEFSTILILFFLMVFFWRKLIMNDINHFLYDLSEEGLGKFFL